MPSKCKVIKVTFVSKKTKQNLKKKKCSKDRHLLFLLTVLITSIRLIAQVKTPGVNTGYGAA